MSAAHTAGPWVATERSGYHEILAPDDSSDWYGRPKMHAVAYCDTEIDEREQIANARLIAAAPNMLTRLIEAEWIIDTQLDGEFPETLREIRAAIKMARTPNEIGDGCE